MRLPVASDAELIYELYATDSDVTKYLAWKPHKSLSETNEFVQSRIQEWKDETRFTWCIESDSSQLKGLISCKPQSESSYSVSYVVGKQFWGQGIGTKAAKELVNYLINQPSVYRVEAFCDTGNIGSSKVLEKLGMEFEGVAKRRANVPNLSIEPQDCLQYALTM
ncbi:GNAT family N-acetyltransferase [Reinekea marinisedimentorum]|uniref:RimJ/RimL family protein N-acetyltransferase n=1 Tax=Reinekea marinisedimentorum TaxID=230495 RepID=A0A4R3HTU1_9GAMM|nr:GNAT family N-acetyltransferase [Reinekea marinisedimentorum]TCS34786.1 RimJ/RimL family protein N-acetyltransferase [Reinekea marinisedimentorum]